MKQGRGTCSKFQSFLIILPNVPCTYYVQRDDSAGLHVLCTCMQLYVHKLTAGVQFQHAIVPIVVRQPQIHGPPLDLALYQSSWFRKCVHNNLLCAGFELGLQVCNPWCYHLSQLAYFLSILCYNDSNCKFDKSNRFGIYK